MDARWVRMKLNHPNSNEHQEVYDDSDQLSDLPDEICAQVLSFLPMKHAVRTSVLSKRWKYLWTTMPELRFTNRQFVGDAFCNCQFVERVLSLRDHRSPIRVFSLNFNVGENGSRVCTWIAMAICCAVQVLNLTLTHLDPSYSLPNCIFRCQTLVEFHLDLHFSSILRVPPFVHLPSLKVLILGQVEFADHASTEKLLSQPLLEKLVIANCNLKNLKGVRISAPKLRELRLEDNNENGCQVLIEGDSLQYFNYSGDLMNEYSIVGSSLGLVHSVISVTCDGNVSTVADHGYKILRSLSSVKNLTLLTNFLEILGLHSNFEELLYALPEFSNMTELKVHVVPLGIEWIPLMGILRRSSLLQSLGLTLEPHDFRVPEVHSLYKLDPVPLCFLMQLKKIEVLIPWSVRGNSLTADTVLRLVGVLLEEAMVLEEMILRCPMDSSWTLLVFWMIKKLPRGFEEV